MANKSNWTESDVVRTVEVVKVGLKGIAAFVLSEDSHQEEGLDYIAEYREQMSAMVSRQQECSVDWQVTETEVRILWILMSVSVDPECSRLMDLAAGEPCEGATDLDVLERLETDTLEERLKLRSALTSEAALNRLGWCNTQYSGTGRLQLRPSARAKETFLPLLKSNENSEENAGSNCAVPARRLGDLVLANAVFQEVREVVDAARGREIALSQWGFAAEFTRGLAISALFDGEPGTGKTLSAEVLAGELDRPLQRVNVARILDKYVGGTQKNIEAAFQEASRTGSVLLFDEADALFAKRMNVESSQDRHANLEINLLLEWMERFDGVVVLTTNLKHGIDKAFERRIGYKVHFPFPGVAERELLWGRLIPAETPVSGELDLTGLAERFELSGGSIKNALLRAAYRCAAQGEGLSQKALEAAAEQECIACGKLVHSVENDRDTLYSI